MLKHCSEYDMNLTIRTVITSHNQSIDNFKKFKDFITCSGCVKEWDITPALYTGKHPGENNFAPNIHGLGKIAEWVTENCKNIKHTFNKFDNSGYKLQRCSTCEEFARSNALCMGGVTTISILPNGQCTICEMLYTNPRYILGNIRKNSIAEIWNCNQSNRLSNPEQTHFSASSPCRKCKDFEQCRSKFGNRVCFSDIEKTGKTFDYPDPRCPKSDFTHLIL